MNLMVLFVWSDIGEFGEYVMSNIHDLYYVHGLWRIKYVVKQKTKLRGIVNGKWA